MALPANTTSSYFTDSEGMSADAIFNAAADQVLPDRPRPKTPAPPVLTTEQRLAALEEPNMALPNTSTPDINDPSYWNQNLPQQQQAAPQIVMPTQAQSTMRLPKTAEELDQRIRQGSTQLLTQLQHHQLAVNETESILRSKFRNHKDLSHWENTAATHYQNQVAAGVDKTAAYKNSVGHVQGLMAQGFQAPKRSRVPNPNSGGGGHHGEDNGGSFRDDEHKMKNKIGFYSADDRVADAKEYIDDRNMDAEYYKSRGSFGRSMQQKHAHLFHTE